MSADFEESGAQEKRFINVLQSFRSSRKELAERYRHDFSRQSLKFLRDEVVEIVDQGARILERFIAQPTSFTESRYYEWVVNHAPGRFVVSMNQLPETLLFYGGTFSLKETLRADLCTNFDRILADLILDTLKVRRSAVIGNDVSTEFEDISRFLREHGYVQEATWRARFVARLHESADTILHILLSLLDVAVIEWLVVLKIERQLRPIVESQPVTITPGLETLELPPPDISGPVFYYSSHNSAAALWDDILRELRIAKTSEEFPVPDLLNEILVPPDHEGYMASNEWPNLHCECSFRLTAHPAALEGGVQNLVDTLSGVWSMLRDASKEQWSRVFLGYRNAEDRHELHVADPSEAYGVAVPISDQVSSDRCQTVVIDDHTALGEPVTLHIPRLFAPLDYEESKRGSKLFRKSVFFWIPMWQTQPSTLVASLHRAFHFWKNAEFLRASFGQGALSPWILGEILLDYCIVLEILLGAKGETTEIISTRGAALISDTPEDRLEWVRRIKTGYDIRSKYVHAGEVDVRLSDVIEMRDIVRRCLKYALLWTSEEGRITLKSVIKENSSADWGEVFPDRDDFVRHCDLLRSGGPRKHFGTESITDKGADTEGEL